MQEALTNVLKHAGPARAAVLVRYEPGAVHVEVVDDGRGAATAGTAAGNGSGHGLVGMRERAALYGGELEAGPRPGGGYRVAATLRYATVVIRVLLADDQALVRAGFRVLIETEPDLEVVGEAADGQEAHELAVAEQPDVVLMDIRMPNVDGIDATSESWPTRAPRPSACWC